MATELDVYQPCFCGSGKKLKFCCAAIADDMLKVIRLLQNNQPQAALQALETLEKKPIKEVTSRAWIRTMKARVLSGSGQLDAAQAELDTVLKEVPQHSEALTLRAMLGIGRQGYAASRELVYAAFRQAGENNGAILSDLAHAVAGDLYSARQFLAARLHLVLALILDRNEDNYKELVRFDQTTIIPFPWRSDYPLRKFSGGEGLRKEFEDAVHAALMGCYGDAARGFEVLTHRELKNSTLKYNLAVCHAAAGDSAQAITAFRSASGLETDFEAAVEDEALAQLLESRTTLPQTEFVRASYRVHAPSKLLSLLDAQPRYVRVELDENAPEGAIADYRILDRDPAEKSAGTVALDKLPVELAQLTILDANAELDAPAEAQITGFAGEEFGRLCEQFIGTAGSEIDSTGKTSTVDTFPAELRPLMVHWHHPADLPVPEHNQLEKAKTNRLTQELWPNLPLLALGGKTPTQAAGVPELKTALAAAVLNFSAFCESNNYHFDEELARSRLGLPAIAALELKEGDDPRGFSILQMRRLPFHELDDAQLTFVTNRALMLRYRSMSYRALSALITRPIVTERGDLSQIYVQLATLCRQRFQREEALAWIAKGKQEARARKAELQELFLWELHELGARAENPNDPQLQGVAEHLWNYFGSKLPGVRETIAPTLIQHGLAGPWNNTSPIVTAGQPAGAGASSLWTPETAASGSESGSKLWLPGQ